mmetsp:Transcript_34308/g.76133  ORF Transcript_34308/g.76133 Transcript_34308/m.76133 type:complete len:465 (-) Transcript_34308:340-1734(-)
MCMHAALGKAHMPAQTQALLPGIHHPMWDSCQGGHTTHDQGDVGHLSALCSSNAVLVGLAAEGHVHAVGGRRSQGVGAHQGGHSPDQQLEVIQGVAGHDGLVQVGVKGHLLHVRVLAELHKGLAGRVGPVEHLLQDVQNLVGGPVLAVPLVQVHAQVRLADHLLAVLGALHNGLSSHAARLGSEVDTLTGALGHVASSITNQGNAALHTAWAGVLRDGVGLNADDLATLGLDLGAVAGCLLVLLNGSLVDDSAGADGHVVVLGEHPAVEVRGHIITHVHLSQVLVVLHLVIGDADALLEGNGVVILAGINVLGDTAVGTVSTNHNVNLHSLGHADLAALSIVIVVDLDGALAVLRGLQLHHQAVHHLSSVLLGTLAQEVIKHLTAAHANPLALAQGLANIHLPVGGGDHLHLGDLAINDLHGQIELLHHAQRDGTTARLAVVHLPLDQESLAATLCQSLSSASS